MISGRTRPSKQRPIYYAPAVTKNDEGKILIFFGTGDEMDLANPNKVNYFYEVRTGATGNRSGQGI